MIPRIDLTEVNSSSKKEEKKGKAGGRKDIKPRQKFVRVPQKIFNPSLLNHKEITKKKNDELGGKHFYYWRNQMFRKGFVYKFFNYKYV